MSLVVAAIGGNALTKEDGGGSASEWFDALTHGNGPQVGEELLRMEIAKLIMPVLTLDLCVAETEGNLGTLSPLRAGASGW